MRSRLGAAILLPGLLLPAALPARAAPGGPGAAPDTALASTGERSAGLAVIPALFYSPETKTGAGAFLIRTLRPAGDPAARPSTLALGALGTQRSQWTVFLAPDFYMDGETWRLTGLVSWSRYPSKFWGLGPDAPEDAEEDYTPRAVALGATASRLLRPGLWLGAGFEFADVRLVETRPGGLIETAAPPGATPFSALGATVQLDADTRDDVFYPSRGHVRQVAVTAFGRALGADHAFTRARVDLRQYVPVGTRQTLALQALGVSTTADPPFPLLPQLGGQNQLRGYYEGRWRDRCLAVVQAEYRRHLRGRFGLALFAGAGAVAHAPDELRLADARVGGGFGLRYRLLRDEKLNLRADFGFGEEGGAFYFAGQEAF